MKGTLMTLAFLVIGEAAFPVPAGSLAWAAGNCPPDGVDEILRQCQALHPQLGLPIPEVGCRVQARSLEELVIDGKTYPWEDYSRWGRQLFDLGYATDPPAGPFDPSDARRSRQVSDFADYTCARCHNDLREDPVLTDQDPNRRFDYIKSREPGADYRTSTLKMTQGVTLWGGVNRMRFYNDHFSFFDTICLPAEETLYRSPDDPTGKNYEPVDCFPWFAPCGGGCRQLDTASFKDAIQTCGRYCGVGRFLEDWELAAFLTYLWDRQVHLDDVFSSLENRLAELRLQRPEPAAEIAKVEWKLRVLEPLRANPEIEPSSAACQALADSYLLTSCDSLRDESPFDPDGSECSRDWTTPPPSPQLLASGRVDPEDLPALFRHLQQRNQEPRPFPLTALQPAPAQPFLSDEGAAPARPLTETEERGKDLYELSCGRCHGASPQGEPQIGGRGHRFLAGSAYVFFKMIEDGLTPSNPIPPNPKDPAQESLYMPEFTLQRLSYQQARDIFDYLLTLPPSGNLLIQEPDQPQQE